MKALLESPGPNLFSFFDPENGVGTVSNTFQRLVSNGSGVLPSLTSPATIQQVSSSISLPLRPARDLEKPLGCPVPPPLTLPPDPVMPMMPAMSDARPTIMSVDEDSESDDEKRGRNSANLGKTWQNTQGWWMAHQTMDLLTPSTINWDSPLHFFISFAGYTMPRFEQLQMLGRSRKQFFRVWPISSVGCLEPDSPRLTVSHPNTLIASDMLEKHLQAGQEGTAYIGTHAAYMVSCFVFLAQWYGSPGTTPGLSICKLFAAFLRSSLVFTN